MVEQPLDYVWSSYRINALGKQSELCSPHLIYIGLGSDPKGRQANYRELVEHHVEGKLLEEIRLVTHKGMPLGDARFKAETERLTGRRMTVKKMGRPVGWRKKQVVC